MKNLCAPYKAYNTYQQATIKSLKNVPLFTKMFLTIIKKNNWDLLYFYKEVPKNIWLANSTQISTFFLTYVF